MLRFFLIIFFTSNLFISKLFLYFTPSNNNKMKITIEDFNEIGDQIEVDYFVDNGDLKTISIDRDELIKDILDNDLNIWCEDKWNYTREEHYTIDHETDPEEYLGENMKDLILAHLYNKEAVK